MATVLVQTPDFVGTETFASPLSAHTHRQSIVTCGISQDEVAQHATAQSRTRKGKNGQKKQPQRGLGVAQLENLRLQEQTMKESLRLTSFRPQPLLPFSGASVLGELGSTLFLPHSFGYPSKGGTLQENSVTRSTVLLERITSAKPGNEESLQISDSEPEISTGTTVGHLSLQSTSRPDPPVLDSISVSTSFLSMQPQQEKGHASCILGQDSLDMRCNVAVVNNATKKVTESKILKILTQQGGEGFSDGLVGNQEHPKSISEESCVKTFLDQIRHMEDAMFKPAETNYRNVLELRSGLSEPPSLSLLNVPYTPTSSDRKQDIGRATDGGSMYSCHLSSGLPNLEVIYPTPGSPGILQNQPFVANISSVPSSSVGETPKELSSFQNYLGLHIWPSIEKVSCQKRKWAAMEDTNCILHTADIANDRQAFHPWLKSQRCTDFGACCVSDHKAMKSSGTDIGRQALTKATSYWMVPELTRLNPLAPLNRNLLSLAKKPTETSVSGNVSALENYVAQPIIYGALKRDCAVDHKKACSFQELWPVQMLEKVCQALPTTTEGCEIQVERQQPSPALNYWMFLSADECALSQKGSSEKAECDIDTKGIPLDLSLRLAL